MSQEIRTARTVMNILQSKHLINIHWEFDI